MKILIVCQYYYPENFVITNIAEELVKFGNEVTVLTGKPNYGYGHILEEYKKIKYQEINGVKIHRVNLKARSKNRLSIIRNYLSFWKNSKRWVRHTKEHFDLVYSMSLSPVTILSAGNLYKKKYHVKHIVHCVDLWPESVLVTHAVRKSSVLYRILYKWSRKLYSKVDHVLLGSMSYADYFKDVLKLDNKMSFVPQPSLVETPNIDPIAYKSGFNILYCGNIGLVQLIDLLPDVIKQTEDVHFHIIGMGPKIDYLLNKVKELKLEDKVSYYGPMAAKKAAAYFLNADAVYVSLSKEGYVGKTIPNRLVMSMAFAKPIIGVLDGDGRKVLEASNGGILCDESISSIVEGINKLKHLSSDERKRLGDNNRVYYENNFSLEKITNQINDILLNELK